MIERDMTIRPSRYPALFPTFPCGDAGPTAPAARARGRIWWGPTGNARPSIKRYLSEVGKLVPRTIWSKHDAGSNRTSKNEMRALFPGDASFDTPKPERLLERVLLVATQSGDLVLDSFAGSGTTGAVAHKMGRRWIMVELGQHCHTHIIPRLKKVIDGEDPGGVTGAVGWQGGGGFRYYRLAPSLLEQDSWGNWVINRDYNAAMLAERRCASWRAPPMRRRRRCGGSMGIRRSGTSSG